MPTPYTEDLPIEISAYRSPIDGRIVVQIDQEESPTDDFRIRVNLNDGVIFDGDSGSSHSGTVDDPLCRAAGQHRRFTRHTRWECAHVTEVDTDG